MLARYEKHSKQYLYRLLGYCSKQKSMFYYTLYTNFFSHVLIDRCSDRSLESDNWKGKAIETLAQIQILYPKNIQSFIGLHPVFQLVFESLAQHKLKHPTVQVWHSTRQNDSHLSCLPHETVVKHKCQTEIGYYEGSLQKKLGQLR